MDNICETSDLLVFSHFRWNFVFQRPQHLISRFSKHRSNIENCEIEIVDRRNMQNPPKTTERNYIVLNEAR